MMAITELKGMREEQSTSRGRSHVVRRDEIILWMMANCGLQNLKIFPQIKAATERESLFK
jgi:hypothetical protein